MARCKNQANVRVCVCVCIHRRFFHLLHLEVNSSHNAVNVGLTASHFAAPMVPCSITVLPADLKHRQRQQHQQGCGMARICQPPHWEEALEEELKSDTTEKVKMLKLLCC